MPPTLRSAHSSPAGKTTAFDASPGLTPGRKAPKCTKCGQSRRGHPRSGCPSIGGTEDMDSSPTKIKPKTLQENLSDALGSMYLESSVATHKAKGSREPIEAPVLQPSDTLTSISTSAEDMLHHLTRPGFFSQVTVSEDGDRKGSKGQDKTVPAITRGKLKSGPQTLMPGTLKAPSWESSIEGLPDAESGTVEKAPPVKSSLGVQTSLRGSDSDAAPTPLSHLQLSSSYRAPIPAQPLQKSQTQEQRQLLLSSLSHNSPATVYIHKKQDVDEVNVSAQAAKLHVRPVYSEDKEEENVLLVVGSDLLAVERLAEELTKSIKNPTPNTTNNIYITTPSTGSAPSSPSTFKAVASGAIMGVVGTWAGLAFS